MTLPPTDSWIVRGLKGPEYKVGPRCCNPRCGKLADHAHHMWRRSRLAGDYAWVEVDGHVVANKVAVCHRCHDDLTGMAGGHRAAIRMDEARLFHWCAVLDSDDAGSPEYHPVGLLEPQPPTPEQLATLAPDHQGSAVSCPFCGHLTKRTRRRPSTPGRRRRRSWLVKVPDDLEEDGAELLDALIENLAPLVPHGDSSTTGRYYVLVPVLAFAQMNSKEFVASWEGL